jgi:PD-(D/E)XK endonuclease
MDYLSMKAKSEKTEAEILARFSGYEGVVVLLPFGGGNSRYDLIVDDNGIFYRIQCKTGQLKQKGTVVEFRSASSTYHYYGGKVRELRDYRGQVEYFGVYCPQNDKAYLVPVDIVGKTEGTLRLTETKNNQEKNVHWAEEYEIEKVMERGLLKS